MRLVPSSLRKAATRLVGVEDRTPKLEALLPLERAFADFCRRAHDRAMAHAQYCLRDYDAACDAVAEALADFYPRWQEVHPEEWDEAFEATVLRCVGKHRKRLRKRAKRHVSLDEDTEQALVFEGELEPRESILLSEHLDMEKLFEEALDALPPRCREVWMLHKYTRLTHAQVAAELGIAENTVMNHMIRAKKILQAYVARAGIRLSAETAKKLVPDGGSKKLLPAATPEASHE